eukprot:GHVR01149295.1.p1 GENE.GHVR01149295.1~~GHVR01149295.1.p1  ORF type:complete len:298 (-),score=116.45 GHVR01149295.1:263-1156(-)
MLIDIVYVILLLIVRVAASAKPPKPPPPIVYTYKLLHTFDHHPIENIPNSDPNSSNNLNNSIDPFTQGYFIDYFNFNNNNNNINNNNIEGGGIYNILLSIIYYIIDYFINYFNYIYNKPHGDVYQSNQCNADDDKFVCHSDRESLNSSIHVIESTGLYGKSVIRRIDLLTGKTHQQTHLPNDIFGEGCSLFTLPSHTNNTNNPSLHTRTQINPSLHSRTHINKNKEDIDEYIIMLSWRENICFIINKNTLEIVGDSYIDLEQGWGVTSDYFDFIYNYNNNINKENTHTHTHTHTHKK